MKKFTRFIKMIPVVLFCICVFNAMGQDKGKLIPPSLQNEFSLNQVETHYLPHSGKDIQSTNNGKEGTPLWAGFSIKTEISLSTEGTVVRWPNGEVSWIARITSPGAPALGLVMEQASFPSNARLYIYSEFDHSRIYSMDYEEISSGFISTPSLPTESLIVEYTEKEAGESFRGSFVITDLIVIYNGLETAFGTKDLGDAEWCQVNINCSPEGDNWQLYKRGIARILFREGSYWYYCTGTLINNTNQDGTPYFLTAEHCGGSASAADRNVWQFYFNYERPGCPNTGTPPTNLRVGCVLKSKGLISGGSDFQLVQLNSAPPQAWNPYYNGWDRNTTPATGGVGIHHPSGDAKKISTYTGTLTSASPNIGGSQMASNSAWRVVWTQTANGHGCTEGGSSGSPIFNNAGMVVGTLSGGSSYCSSPSSPDYYGKFSYHWQTNGATNDKRLAPWLDPANTGVMTLPGYDPYGGIIPNFIADKTVAFIGEEVVFTDLSTGSNITSWSWNFGEGANPATATGQGPHTVTYSSLGYKTISLTLNGQETETKEDYIYIKEPSNTYLLYEQEPNTVGGNAVNSTLTSSSNYLVAENFPELTGNIEKIVVYGIYAINTGSAWSECTPEDNISFNVALYDPNSQQPDWNNPTHSFTLGSESSIYGSWGDWTMRQWDIELPGQVSVDGEGWISVQANNSTCWFLWINSTVGDGYAYQYTGSKAYKNEYLSIEGNDKGPLNYDVGLQLWAGMGTANILSFDFEEDVITDIEISYISNSEAEINVEVANGTDVTNLTPTITITPGATIDPQPVDGVYGTMDFSQPQVFVVTSEDGEKQTTYTVTVTEEPPVFNVTFIVKDEGGNDISGAIITLGNTTNSAGNYHFEGLLAGSYSYSVARSGYVTGNGTITIVDEDVTETVTLVKIVYTVTFNVLDKNNSPLSGATITLGTTTNPPDDYDFVVEPGTYSYSVQLQDYYAEEGNVTVTNQNVTVNVIMTHVGIEDNTLSQIKVYPIPFEDYLIITGIAKVSRISIANLIGSNVVINDNLGNDRMFLSTEKLSQGVYLMTFYLTSGERVVKKVVKR